jgi:hypothetical protein
MRDRIEAAITEAVEFADASPEPPLDTLYDNLYVVGDQVPGWSAVDERAPQPFAGEREREELAGEAKKLAEAGAAYAGRAAPTGRRDLGPVADRDEAEAIEEESPGEPSEDED